MNILSCWYPKKKNEIILIKNMKKEKYKIWRKYSYEIWNFQTYMESILNEKLFLKVIFRNFIKKFY